MAEEVKALNIYQKMSRITDEINRVAKNLKVGVGSKQYKAVGEADVLEAVKPVEIKYGIYSYPLARKIVEAKELTVEKDYNGTKDTKTNMFMRVETLYRFINIDNPSEYIETISYGDGVDPQDKAPGKAQTYSDKYALLKAYKIETGDDPDQEISGNIKKPVVNDDGARLMRLANMCSAEGITLTDVAVYYKCKDNQVTEDMVNKIIEGRKAVVVPVKTKARRLLEITTGKLETEEVKPLIEQTVPGKKVNEFTDTQFEQLLKTVEEKIASKENSYE